MTSVFLSYDREDTDRARPIAVALEKAGHSVWWDRHIKSGAQYSQEIDEALKRSEAVVVLWSERSIQSAWVRDEAAAGRDSGKLVPALIGAVDPPLGFRQYQTTNLTRWKGRSRSAEFREMLEAIEALASGQKTESPMAFALKLPTPRLSRPVLVAVAAALVLAVVLIVWRPWSERSSTPVVAVAAASQSTSARSLARDLLAKLGNLQANQTESLKLVEGGEANRKADLVFEVDGARQGQVSTANLVLLGGKERALLWSKDFEQPIVRHADLKQQLAYTAAKVLECAVEALKSEGLRMPQSTLKLYLNGCSAYAETAAADPRQLLPVFRAVVEQAPRFEGAWAKLLNVESELAFSHNFPDDAEKLKLELRQHMEEARKLNPDLAEIYLAEADFAPPNAFAKRMQLIERAVEQNPESSVALSAHSNYLMDVGRNFESIDRAKRATQLDPLSPFTRDSLISALTYAGSIDEALEELRKAEQLWPGASNLLGSRYRIHLRYGDPQEALRIQRTGDYGGPHRDAFLKARIDPTSANVESAILRPRRWLEISPLAIGELAQVLGAFGREEELFTILLDERRPLAIDAFGSVLFRPALSKFRYDPRMIAVANRIGLLDYWRKSGKWPDFCREPDLPYNCEVEAAKLGS